MTKTMPERSRRTLFLTSAHPGGSGIIGAGEGICESSLRTLVAAGHEVHVLCFANRNQVSNPDLVALCASYRTLDNTWAQSLIGVLRGLRWGSAIAPWFFTRVSSRNVRAVAAAIREHHIDGVWIDFPSSLGFTAHLGGIDAEYFAHDVVSQKIGRRPLLAWLKPWVERSERRLISFVRRCFVLSEKDSQLLRGLGFSGEIVVTPPQSLKVGSVAAATPVADVVARFEGGKNLVFFGNMRRPENHWSIMHFLFFSYRRIRATHADVQFWVIGMAPRWSLVQVSRMFKGVHVVGAVDDPEPAFRMATLCVAPMRYGAGVKIKVLQMLDAGAKVVSTPVGAEGITDNPRLVVVSDDRFADSVCSLLHDSVRPLKDVP